MKLGNIVYFMLYPTYEEVYADYNEEDVVTLFEWSVRIEE